MSETPSETSVSRYFETIERTFVRLRGAPLLLSPDDWRTAKRWHEDGIPIGVVVDVLESVFERRRERGSTGKISSLAYCAPAVEEAWSEIEELGAAAGRLEAEAIDVNERLALLADALPQELSTAAEIRSRLAALEGPAEEIESVLQRLDREMLERAAKELDPETLEAVRERACRALDRSRRNLKDEEANEVEAGLFREFLRRRLGLPTLSLFHTGPLD